MLKRLMLTTALFLLVACEGAPPTSTPIPTPSVTPSPTPSPYTGYLAEEIPPCTPVTGSPVDPCEPDIEFNDLLVPVAGAASLPFLGDEPQDLREMLEFDGTPSAATHVMLRGTFLPGTERCTPRNPYHPPSYLIYDEYNYVEHSLAINCYADVRVNAYILGSGPSTLTTLTFWHLYWDGDFAGMAAEEGMTEAEFIEKLRRRFETLEYAGGVGGREAILFIGPSSSLSAEVWEVRGGWDVQRQDDGTVVAVHPDRDLWRRLRPDDYQTHRSTLEMELPAFKQAVTTANQARVTEYDGRIGADEDLPDLVTDANNLRKAMTDAGAYDDPDNPPAQPPPPCGLAVSNQADNPSLKQDCTALLAAKDALRGTASLNWSVERPIAEWDGVTTGGTPLRVTRLELPDKSLTGSVPAELGRLSGLTRLDLSANSLTGALPEELGLLSNLAFIRLAGNSFTGCVPHTLRNVADSDLDSIGIPYCPAPVCIQPFPNPKVTVPTQQPNVTITTPTLQLQREALTHAMQSWDPRCKSSHAPTHNAQFFNFVNHDAERVDDEVVIHTMRVNIKMTTRHDDVQLLLLGTTLLDGLEPDAPIVATAEPVEAEAGALRTLEIEKVVPYGAYTIEVRARNPGDATFDLTAAHVYDPPEFEQDSYTFSVAEDAERFTTVGTVVAVDEGGRAVTYRITSGAAGKFSITHNRGMIVVNSGLDYEANSTYTLTVEARNPDGRTSTATVTINVTGVAGT